MEYNCRGGPMQSKLLVRREGRGFKGVLLVDRPADRCWIYEWDEASKTFACREEKGQPILEEGLDRAADEESYDVVAAPWA